MALGQKIDNCFALAVVFVNWWNYTNGLVPFTIHSMHSAHWHMDHILAFCLLILYEYSLPYYVFDRAIPCGIHFVVLISTAFLTQLPWTIKWWCAKYVANSVCLILVVTKRLSPNMLEIRTTQVNKWRITSPFALVFSSLWDSLTKTKAVLATNCRCQVTFTYGNCSLVPV